MSRRRGEPVARSAEPRCRDATTLRTATSQRTGRNMRGAAARPADMGPADVRPADMRRPEMHPAAACPEAYSAAVPAKPAAMSAKASEVSATTMPTAAAAAMSPATAAMPAIPSLGGMPVKRHQYDLSPTLRIELERRGRDAAT